MSKADSSLNPILNLTLSSIFLRPTEAYRNGGLDSICRGMLSDPANVYDPHVTDVLENHLFENNQVSGRETHRFSLPAINIIRGRDHGLPSYTQFRSLRLKVDADNVTQVSFDDLASDMPVENLSNLKMVYKNADDIDAFSGGLSETPLTGGVLGPTFARKRISYLLLSLIKLSEINLLLNYHL
jgi:peroxidase